MVAATLAVASISSWGFQEVKMSLIERLQRHGERTGLDQAKLIKAFGLGRGLYHFHKMQGQRVLQAQVFLLLDR